MNFRERIVTVRPYFPFYLIGALAVIGMKYYYSKASCDGLLWILAPTARLVTVFSGIPFAYEANAGYINHELRFLIAASCSGVQFMMITMAVLVFSFVHRMGMPQDGIEQKSSRQLKRCLFWTLASIGASYLLTVLVNSLRIVLSVYLPIFFQNQSLYNDFLTPERLHTMTGATVYFVSLLTIYHLADDISLKIAHSYAIQKTDAGGSFHFADRSLAQTVNRFLPPVFWYFLIVLGLPYLNGAYRKNKAEFGEFALLIFLLCAVVLCLFCTGLLVWKKAFSGKKRGL